MSQRAHGIPSTGTELQCFEGRVVVWNTEVLSTAVINRAWLSSVEWMLVDVGNSWVGIYVIRDLALGLVVHLSLVYFTYILYNL